MEKQHNYNNICEEEEEEDRLSDLPDDVIHHVMSFLSSKDSVQTCVLSRRWSLLWKSLPYLHFDLSNFSRGDNYNNMSRFINFIIRMLLSRRHTDLVKVHVNATFDHGNDGCVINALMGCRDTLVLELLICYALEHNVQELDVSADYFTHGVFPLSSCKCYALKHGIQGLDITALFDEFKFPLCFGSLTKLKLKTVCGFGYNMLDLHLPALESLELVRFEVRDQDFYSRLFSTCPNLQTLKVVDNFFADDHFNSLRISAPNLKSLEFSYSSPGTWFYRHGLKVVIDAPNLTTFKFNGFVPICFLLANNFLTILDQVCFDLELETNPDLLCLINNLKEFSDTNSLSLRLSFQTVEAPFELLVRMEESQLQFPNLKYLNLRVQEQCKDLVIPTSILNKIFGSCMPFVKDK